MSTLLVPLRVDALSLHQDLHAVLTPLADFSGLPWANGGSNNLPPNDWPHDVNPDVAFTSQNVLAAPFSDTYGSLEKGVHVHWALPDAFAVGRHPRRSDGTPDQERVEFPAVPNRWLVVRSRSDQPTRRWVIESDYLWPENEPWAPGRVTYPIAKRHPQGKGESPPLLDASHQPYRYLGRVWAAEEWSEDPKREHIEKLLAIGYGEPTFAAFYPSCRGVFGFHDTFDGTEDLQSGRISRDQTYEVFGWYSDVKNDLLHQLRGDWTQLISRLREQWTKQGLDHKKRESKRLEREAARDLKWCWDHLDRKAGDQSYGEPDRILCHGSVKISSDAAGAEASDPDRSVKISAGNTGTEALSAYLAGEIAEKEKIRLELPDDTSLDSLRSRIEHQLEALHLTDATQGQRLDLGAKFKEARHDKSFHGVPGGTVWTLKPRATGGATGATSAKARMPVMDSLAQEHRDAGTKADKIDNIDPHAASKGQSAIKASAGTMAALPHQVATALHEINKIQSRVDRANAEIASLRRQIFSEWHKYITCCYHPDYARHDYPAVDVVKRHIEGLIALLDVKIAYAGELDAAHRDDPSGLKTKLAALADNTLTRLASPMEEEFRQWCEDMTADASGFVSLTVQLAGLVGRTAAMLATLSPVGLAARALAAKIEDAARPDDPAASTSSSARALADLPALVSTVRERIDILTGKGGLAPGEGVIVDAKALRSTLDNVAHQLASATQNRSLARLAATVLSRVAPLAAIPDVELAAAPAPRYWQPNDPVLLLAGPGVRRSERHGHEGLLTCHVLDAFDPNPVTRNPKFDQLLRAALDQENHSRSAVNETNGNPWHPLFMEWEVEIEPRDGNVPPNRRSYPADFVKNNYILSEDRCEFLASHGIDMSTTTSSSYVSGRSVLTAHAGTILERRIDDYLIHQLKLYLRAKSMEEMLDDTEKAFLVLPQGDASEVEGRVDLLREFLEDKGKRAAFEKWCDEVYRMNMVDVFVHSPALAGPGLPQIETKRLKLAKPPLKPEKPLQYFDKHKAVILAWFKECISGSTQSEAPVRTVLAAREQLKSAGNTIQSQALGGFNEALLMQQEVLQFDPVDPLGFAEYREFSEKTVHLAVENHTHTAPLPHFDFHPIRTGEMKLARVRLVDTFGRVFDLPTRLNTTQQLYCETDNAVSLPPRITQPARINFRWLSAAGDAQECNPHPLTSPICGWLVPNNLDRSLMIYDGFGVLLGYVDRNGRWRSAPGRPGPVLAADISNSHLFQMVAWLQEQGRGQARFIDDFIDVLDSALEKIDPEGFEQHEARALLMGRPLALVRASVNLELHGLPAYDQSWDALHQALSGQELDTDKFPDVLFPIRIGEHHQLNDGVAGFWVETAQGYQEGRFYAPQSESAQRPADKKNVIIQNEIGKPLNFLQSVADPPHMVSILLDPRGAAHCTSGVLPTKALRIPQEHYTEALKALRVTFLTSPLLTPPGRTEIPLPAEPGWMWSWVQRDGQGWTERSTEPVVERNDFVAAAGEGMAVWLTLLEYGWLKQIDEGRSEARVTAQNERRKLPKALLARKAEIETVLGTADTFKRSSFVEAVGHGAGVWKALLASSCNWLEPLDDAGTRARLVPPEMRKNLPKELKFRKTEIQKLLDVVTHALAPAHLEARFGPAAEIREGWLQLTPKSGP